MVEVCKPIDTLDEVYSYMNNPPKWGIKTVSISKRSKLVRNKDLYTDSNVCHYPKGLKSNPIRFDYGALPKTLICHDMKNGYHEDSHIDGFDDHSVYLFYHWSAIDIFVYFSHHFVTIPPLGWINVAHKHGVQILGTIITEWNEGKNICSEILKSEESMQKFVRHIVSITKYLKMDGWLLNIENNVSEIDMLKKLVKHLSEELHRAVPNSLIIWYDSVTKTGDLDWQNCLNDENKIFFDNCDGIFTNYCWTRGHLEKTVATAGTRKNDVFVGVDVWGRNFWGGGCLNTAEAVKEIYNYNLSMAIFAPAWTHEAINIDEALRWQNIIKPSSDIKTCLEKKHDANNIISEYQKFSYSKCALKTHFMLRENALWNTLWPYLNTRGPSQLPFHTYFCLGSGEKRRYAGKVLDDKVWFNLREQQYQLTTPACGLNFLLENIRDVNTSREKRETDQTLSDSDILQKNQNSTSFSQSSTAFEIEEVVSKIDTNLKLEHSPNKFIKPPIKKIQVKPNTEDIGCLNYFVDDSFYGGSCIKISPIKPVKGLIRLFQCEFQCDNNFIVYYIVKPMSTEYQDLNIILTIRNQTSKKYSNFVLCGEEFPIEIAKRNSNDVFLRPLNKNSSNFKNIKKNLQPGFYVDVENDAGWNIRYYYVNFSNSKIMSIDCELVNDTSPMLLGGLGVSRDITMF